ncbi:hypothetical protein CDAR_561441, partial [Caerostris darwini]
MDNILLPSQCKDKEYIYMPSDPVDFEEVTYRQGGKWMLYTEDINHDSHWKSLLPLYHEGLILGLKASAAKTTELQIKINSPYKIIMCYTEDSDDLEYVSKVVRAIRSATKYGRIMYYKSNAASMDGLYHHEGKTSVSKYMHTVNGQLFIRDSYNRWRMDSVKNILHYTMENNKASADEIFRFDKGALSDDSDSDESENTSKDDYDEDCSANNKGQKNSYEEIWSPQSTSTGKEIESVQDQLRKVRIRKTGKCLIKKSNTKRGSWSLKCDFQRKDFQGLTEADRVWSSLNDLMRKEPAIINLRPTKFSTEHGFTYINCPTPDNTDEDFILKVANIMRK